MGIEQNLTDAAAVHATNGEMTAREAMRTPISAPGTI